MYSKFKQCQLLLSFVNPCILCFISTKFTYLYISYSNVCQRYVAYSKVSKYDIVVNLHMAKHKIENYPGTVVRKFPRKKLMQI